MERNIFGLDGWGLGLGLNFGLSTAKAQLTTLVTLYSWLAYCSVVVCGCEYSLEHTMSPLIEHKILHGEPRSETSQNYE